jgi:hypothetical protein
MQFESFDCVRPVFRYFWRQGRPQRNQIPQIEA